MRDAGGGVGRSQHPQHLGAVTVVGGDDVVRRNAVGVGTRVLDLERWELPSSLRPAPAQLSAVAVPKVMIPGAPPLMLLSVTLIRATPFCRNEIVEPTAVNCNCVPAANGPQLYELPSCTQVPALRLYTRSCWLPLFQK